MIRIQKYESHNKEDWEALISKAANGHFMFRRDYMDYHRDRFLDCSYIVFEDEELIGAFPASQNGDYWNSHGGLTFGGLIISAKKNRISNICDIYQALFERLKEDGFASALIKPLPWIYHQTPCEGELYALGQAQVTEQLVEVTTTIDLGGKTSVSNLRKRQQKKALKAGFTLREDNDYASFWQVLSQKLESKYARKPVHTLEEITSLAAAFPDQISLHRVLDSDGTCVGGSVIFSTDTLWHAQYISASDDGMASGALDLLFLSLIEDARRAGKSYFDFGISTEEGGAVLNRPLASFKEGFGGRSVVHRKITVKVS